jgi:hypothetical protein
MRRRCRVPLAWDIADARILARLFSPFHCCYRDDSGRPPNYEIGEADGRHFSPWSSSARTNIPRHRQGISTRPNWVCNRLDVSKS